tara:strand:+ start:2382 stop:2870 length:489 start_codon:yes stop_codon:yes gene_type:complete
MTAANYLQPPLDKHAARKATPVFSGVLAYFPDAINAIARCSMAGNEQHNPGTELHWDRAKSGDEKDACTRHLMQTGTMDEEDILHDTKAGWRALANLQKVLEGRGEAPLSPYNKIETTTLNPREGDLCPHCRRDTLEHCVATPPYSVEHLSCPQCDSTYNIL